MCCISIFMRDVSAECCDNLELPNPFFATDKKISSTIFVQICKIWPWFSTAASVHQIRHRATLRFMHLMPVYGRCLSSSEIGFLKSSIHKTNWKCYQLCLFDDQNLSVFITLLGFFTKFTKSSFACTEILGMISPYQMSISFITRIASTYL